MAQKSLFAFAPMSYTRRSIIERSHSSISAVKFPQCAISRVFRAFSAIFQFNQKTASAPERSFSTESVNLSHWLIAKLIRNIKGF
jgi:hypothetical protein